MSNKYLEAYSYLDNGKINYQSFKLIEDGNIKKKYSPSGDSKIVRAMEEFNIRPTGSLKYHQAIIKNEMFVNYVDNYLIPKNKKKKKRNKNFKLSKKWWAFIATASVLAIIALSNKADEVSASENETTITTESTPEEDITPIKEEAPLTIEKNVEITTPTDANNEESIFEENELETNLVYNDFEDIFQFSADYKWTDYHDYVENHYGSYLDKYCSMYGMSKELAIAIISQENPTNSTENSSAHGPAQTEYVHDKEELTCFNQQTKQNDTIIIDINKIDTDMDYAMKVFIMMYMKQFNDISNNYGYKLSDAELIDISTLSYNLGQYIVTDGLYNSDNYEDAIKYIYAHRQGGDKDYREHVYSYIVDGVEINIIGSDGITHSAIFDNTNINDYVSNSSETKTMAH